MTKNAKRSFASFYEEGWRKGRYDAARGITAKLLSHIIVARSAEMRAWEQGYLAGYSEKKKEVEKSVK